MPGVFSNEWILDELADPFWIGGVDDQPDPVDLMDIDYESYEVAA